MHKLQSVRSCRKDAYNSAKNRIKLVNGKWREVGFINLQKIVLFWNYTIAIRFIIWMYSEWQYAGGLLKKNQQNCRNLSFRNVEDMFTLLAIAVMFYESL